MKKLKTGNIELYLNSNPTAIIWIISILLFLVDRYIKKLKINIFPLLFIIAGITTIIWYTINIIA